MAPDWPRVVGNGSRDQLLAPATPQRRGERSCLGMTSRCLPGANREFARQAAYLPQHPPSAENLLGRELVEMGRYPGAACWAGWERKITVRWSGPSP